MESKNRVVPRPRTRHASSMGDYERIARIIQYLDEHQREQPSLERLAEEVGLSPSHFHRLFARWAGLTPKDFLQGLTLAHAKALLRAGHSVCAAAWESGLSGPSRLHDLCVNLECASPGEWKAQGADWLIRFGCAASPFGPVLLAEGPRGLLHLAFVTEAGKKAELAQLQSQWPRARFCVDHARAAELAREVFRVDTAPGSQPKLRAYVRATHFQWRVWRALIDVPFGALTTYGALATASGDGQAARAVGSAVGQNPLAYLIPCHRVIRQSGIFGEYRWGTVRKRAILSWERAQSLGRETHSSTSSAAALATQSKLAERGQRRRLEASQATPPTRPARKAPPRPG